MLFSPDVLNQNSEHEMPENPVSDSPEYDLLLSNWIHLDSDRIKGRKAAEERASYAIKEEQETKTGLFPSETKQIKQLFDQCRNYMDGEDIEKIFPALRLGIFGHQRQFRKSGDPYSQHFLQMAIWAAEGRAPWEAIAVCCIHDLDEDSKEYGHQVTPRQVRLAYEKISLIEEGRFLAQAMGDMREVTDDEAK